MIMLAAGVVVGATVGLAGPGGAILAVPVLVFLAGLAPAHAVSISLVVVGLSAVAGLAPRLHHGIDERLVAAIGVAGAPAAWAGASVGERLDGDVLMLTYASVMVLAGILMLLSGRAGTLPARSGKRKGPSVYALVLGTGLVAGFLTGLLGVGGGFLLIPMLTLCVGMDLKAAVATSLAVIAINSAAGFTAHLRGPSLDWLFFFLAFTAVAMAVSLAGAQPAALLSGGHASGAFPVVVLLVAVGVSVASLPAAVSGGMVAGGSSAGDSGAGGSPAGGATPESTPDVPSGPPPPTTPATSDLSAELSASRLFAGDRTVLLKVSNQTPDAVDISGARLFTDLYAEPQQWVPARPEPVRLRAGGTVSLPIPLANPVCPPDGPNGPDASAPLASVDLPSGAVDLEASDLRGDFSALHHQDCVLQGVDTVAHFSTAPQLEVAPDGRTAVVRVFVEPSGTGSLVLHRIDATPLLASGDPPWPSEVTVRGTDPPREFALTIVPQRCDAHALAEDKLGTHLPLTLTVGGYSGQVRLAPPAEFTAAVYGFVQQACAAR